MTEVTVNYNFNITEVAANMAVEGFQSAEVEAIMKTAGDDMIWNAIEDTKDMDMCDEDFFVTGGGKDTKLVGIAGVPLPKPVDKTSPHVIKIAQFAVKKHNEKAGTKLVFIKVVGGVKWSAIAGTFYALQIETQDSKGTYRDKTLVVEAVTGHKKLIWYKH
ncbi:cysteine proteinase inhibitor 4-like [Coffea eugenioides]|uniref:cysteine proteinase inhibitor 4-like n=1 Tax=Coffea eugenioides TaxID=49369 RepID=UPI000F60C180|nr:cysteine proteinase inhibitor 4-like [Coffea eugenioides]